MRRFVAATVVTVVLTLSVTTAAPAEASHLSMYIYSPYTGSSWIYTKGEHPANERRLNTAHDVSWPSTPGSINFNATSGYVGIVEKVADNCSPSEPWDKYVVLSIWNSAKTEFYGIVHYVHITNPTVSTGNTVSPGNSLGSPQTQASQCWQGVHIHLEHSDNGTWLNDGSCGPPPNYTWCSYSSPVIRMSHSSVFAPVTRNTPAK